jgi:arylsulfatase A-like enzyme/Flp pilus assembly protein TadD
LRFRVRLMRLMTKFCVLAIVVPIVVIAGGIWFLSWSGLVGSNIHQIILVSIDTCRADYLSCYGYPRRTTPNIDAIARQSVRFEQAISPVPLTLPAHSSMLTGTIPPYHGVRDNLTYKFRDRNTTIAEILQENGYRTGAIISAFVLDARFGLNQGFETYNDDFIEARQYGAYLERKAHETSEFACRWIQKHRDEKFFLFLHYFDPHDAYVPPEPFASMFADKLYAGEIAYTDHCIGQVIRKLKELGLYDSALIIIVGDHGESLWEHAEETHGYFIYQSTVKIPLIFKMPRGSEPSTVSEPVAVIDIVPTILSMLRIPVPSEVQGRDLSGLLTKKQREKRQGAIYCESMEAVKYGCNPLFGVVQGEWKYIETTRPELYRFTQDPNETNNLAETESERAQALRGQLKRILSEQSYRGEQDSKATLDQRSLQRLSSLGYIGGGIVDKTLEFDPGKDDAKDLIGFYNLYMKLHGVFKEQKYDEAEGLCWELLRQRPDFVDAHSYLGEIAAERGDTVKAIAYFRQALQLDNKRCDVLQKLAAALTSLGNLDEAVQYLQEAVRLRPEDPKSLNNLGIILARQEKLDEATALFQKVMEIDPDDADAYSNLGNVFALQGRMDEAAEYWSKSLRLKPDQTEVLENLGKISFQKGRIDQAIGYWKRSLQVDPKQPGVYFNLGFALSKKEDISQAIEYYQKAVQLKPDYYQAHTNLANLLNLKGNTAEAIQHWRQSLEAEPKQANAHQELGTALVKQDRIAEAVSHFKEAARLKPNRPDVLKNLAWILATYRDGRFHNPKEAVRFAENACLLTDYKDIGMLDTLAAAYAAAGKFDDAAATAQKAVDLALSSGQQERAQIISKRLELYKAGKPYYEQD